jgi:prefoldin subunit 5
MSTILRPKSLQAMDEEVERLTRQLADIQPLSDDYSKILKLITELTEARSKKNERAVSTDVLLTVGANIVGILLVLNYERLNVISTKALTMVWRK